MKAIRIMFLAALAIALAAAPLYAEDGGFGQEHIYHYPEIKPEVSLWGGYWLADANGSRRAGEFMYFEDSPAAGILVVAFPFPHRFHLEADLKNGKDYFADLRYSYKDMLLVRAVNRSLFHNFGNITLVDGGGGILRNDIGEVYGYRAAFGNIYLRFKAPNYPAHAFVNVWYMDKDGDRQQRRIGGSGWHNAATRVTEKRDVDWSTYDVTAGANGHLGPIEAEYAHSERRFDAANAIDSAFYAFSPSTPPRAPGIYPHSVVSELEGRTDTLKVHTTYTGRLVATGTFSVSDDENQNSAANTDYYLASGEVVWTPVAKFTTAVRFRYEERDMDNPDSLPANYLGFASYTTPLTGIRNSISADISTLSLITRFRPTNKVTLGADATFKHWDRDNAQEWRIEEDTDETTLGASVSLRALRNLKLKARYRYKHFEDPAYNIQPDDSHHGDISVTWTPTPRAVLFASYGITSEERDHLHLTVALVGDPYSDSGAENRDVLRQTATATLTVMPLDNLSFTGSWGFWSDETEQDIAYSNGTGTAVILDRDIKYKDWTTNYSFSADFSPLEQLNLHGGISYTRSKAGFDAMAVEAVTPLALSYFSKLNIRETAYDFSAYYEFIKDLEVGFRFEYREFDDRFENQLNPEYEDGTAQTYLVTLNKRW